MSEACDRCTRRSWLVGRLSGHLDQIRGNRPAIRGVLALSDRKLIAALSGREKATITAEWSCFDAAAARREWRSSSTQAICRHNQSFPPSLADLPDPPAVLHLYGDPARFEQLISRSPSIALVGSRRASADGLEVARELGRTLSLCGVSVISGMALGIDAAAHAGALKNAVSTTHGATVAVIGTGIDLVYPARHRALAHKIAEEACLVSEYPLGTPAIASNFPRRNRLISGLASGVLVVEAAAQSGSLITARSALEQGRDVFAIPGSIHSPLSKGCHQLIRQGAKLVESAQDILEEWQWPQTSAPDRTSSDPASVDTNQTHDPGLQQLLDAAGYDPVSVDQLATRTSLPSAAIQAGLLTLEMRGQMEALSGGQYRRLM